MEQIMKKLVLIGYGRMGKLLDEMSADCGFEIVSRIDPQLGTRICREDLHGGKIAIEFTEPGVAFENICQCVELGVKVVSGTTGWHHRLDELSILINKHRGAVLWGSNFSPGMNVFYEIVRAAARKMEKLTDYDVYGYELHHRYKKDSPSGTAKQLAEILLSELSGKQKVVYDVLQRSKETDEIQFSSVRAGEIPGEHRIGFDSFYDTIELRHTTRNRRGLAAGALMAADWLASREGLHEFKEVLGVAT
jgi:4-hydroxy-tetrahydrodipicolinate reductase